MSREEQVETLLTDAFRSSTRNPEHLAFLAAPVVAKLLADERAAALREAADKWQWGEWTVLTAPIKAESQPQRIIGAAQAVTDWLRDRADEVTR